MQRTPWIKRKFHFKIPPGWLPNILERLAGTESRLIAITRGVSEEKAAFKPGGQWSIKEHIGHLCDLETLHIGRINDFIFRVPELRAADMTNAYTNKADHNQKTVLELIDNFVAERNILISHIKKLDDDTQRCLALHPRLKKMMRPVDMAFFTAEHDDHHMATIRMLIEQLYPVPGV